MTDREKLIALIANGVACPDDRDPFGEYCDSCRYEKSADCSNERLADHLIAHGVTVQGWIPVTERLPEKQGFYRVYHKNSKAICDRFYYKDCPDLFVNVKDDPITHWKPMEQPPKGE